MNTILGSEVTPISPFKLEAPVVKIAAGAEVTDFPLPRCCVSLRRACELNGITIDEFSARQETWLAEMNPLIELINRRSERLHLPDPARMRETDFPNYMKEFTAWQEQVGRYCNAVDAQTLISNGKGQEEVESFKTRMAKVAIAEGLLTLEDCEGLGIKL